MTEKKSPEKLASLKVFICSTYRDLTVERKAIISTIERLQLEHDSMELFGARADRPIEICLKEVDNSDILVVVVGHLYGSLVPERKISFTEAEYREAMRIKKPCLVYLRDENVPILPKDIEQDPENLRLLNDFKAWLRLNHTTDTFKDDRDLAQRVFNALQRTLKELKIEVPVQKEQLSILQDGANRWNELKRKNKLPRSDDSKAGEKNQIDFSNVNFTNWNLEGIDLAGVRLAGADFTQADLTSANLEGADLSRAQLVGANLKQANLSNANLLEANLTKANFSRAKLTKVNLAFARIIETVFEEALIKDCYVYGVSVWKVYLDNAQQSGLIISPPQESVITIDDIEIAQLNYLMLTSNKIRKLIDNVTTKNVLVLGVFTGKRKIVAETIRSELQQRNLLPTFFDFERTSTKDLTETIMTLAGMSRFIIADLTGPRSIPSELSAILPNFRIPVVPIIEKGERPFAMFQDMKLYPWVLTTCEYNTPKDISNFFDKIVMEPVNAKLEELQMVKDRMFHPKSS